jgi:hypothetical protein
MTRLSIFGMVQPAPNWLTSLSAFYKAILADEALRSHKILDEIVAKILHFSGGCEACPRWQERGR